MDIKGGHMVSQIKQISDRIFERILSEHRIDAFNGAQGRILYVLWQEEHISLRETADRTGLAATTLTSMIDRMEDAGLVCRIPDRSDRRRTLLALTAKARELQPEYQAVSHKMTQLFYSGFSENEISLCESMLCRIHANLRQYDQLIPKEMKRRTNMNSDVKNYVTEKVNELLNAASCCAEARAAGKNWLDALGTDQEAEASRKLVSELEMDIMPVDGLIAFADSEAGIQVFGEETAKNVAAHGRELKAAGVKYCDCPACAAAEAILARKNELI